MPSCFFVLFGRMSCFFLGLFGIAQIRMIDPEPGAYVSGDYEITLVCEQPEGVNQTRVWLNGRIILDAGEWRPQFIYAFGEEIAEHELYAEIKYTDGRVLRSETVVTKALRVDFAHSTELLLLAAVVKTRSNKPLLGLKKKDFRVEIDARPAEIAHFYKEALPLDLAMLLDASSSLRGSSILALKQAALLFLNELAPSDRVALYAFQDKPQKLASFTTNRRRLTDLVSSLESHGETALFDALLVGLKDLKQRRKGKKAVLLFTDGRDSVYEEPAQKAKRLREAITLAQNKEVTLFTLGLGRKVHKLALKRLAEETGGRFYYAENSSRLTALFTEIIRDLKSQYVLGVLPNSEKPGFHRIEIKVERRRALIYARKGFETR